MAGSVALDTNVVVNHFPDPVRFAQPMLDHSLYLPVTVVAELRAGARKSGLPEHHSGLIDRFLLSATVLQNDLATAEIYGEIWAALAEAGTMIPTNDIWIAASAIQYGFTLVTTDAHFASVPGLTTENW